MGQPDMNLGKQLRKASQLALELHQQGRYAEEIYIDYLAQRMKEEYAAGRAEPWSYYLPRYHEEFGGGGEE